MVEHPQLTVNAHLNVGGSEGRVVQTDSGLTYVARDDGKVEIYTTESVYEDASVVNPPEDKPVVDPTASPGQGIQPVDQTTSINVPPGRENEAAEDKASADKDAEIADLKSQLAAKGDSKPGSPIGEVHGSITEPGSGPVNPASPSPSPVSPSNPTPSNPGPGA